MFFSWLSRCKKNFPRKRGLAAASFARSRHRCKQHAYGKGGSPDPMCRAAARSREDRGLPAGRRRSFLLIRERQALPKREEARSMRVARTVFPPYSHGKGFSTVSAPSMLRPFRNAGETMRRFRDAFSGGIKGKAPEPEGPGLFPIGKACRDCINRRRCSHPYFRRNRCG